MDWCALFNATKRQQKLATITRNVDNGNDSNSSSSIAVNSCGSNVSGMPKAMPWKANLVVVAFYILCDDCAVVFFFMLMFHHHFYDIFTSLIDFKLKYLYIRLSFGCRSFWRCFLRCLQQYSGANIHILSVMY